MEGSFNNPFFVDFSISVDDNTVCYFTDVTLEAVLNEDINGVTYDWNFGSGASPLTATGIGPHVVQYSTAGSKTVTVTAFYESTETVETTNITVSSCPGGIAGHHLNSIGGSIGSHSMKLYEDFNNDNIPDGAAIRTINSNGATNAWVFASVPPGRYIVEYNTGGVPNNIIAAVDTASQEPTVDPIVFTAPVANKQYFSVTVRVGQVEGFIELTTTP